MPSFLTGKLSRLVTAAVASTLVATAAAAASTAAATLPSRSGPAPTGTGAVSLTILSQRQNAARAEQGNVMTSAQRLDGFDQVRFGLGEIQYRDDVAAAKAATAAKAAAVKAAEAKAAAARTTAAPLTAVSTPSRSPQQIAQQMLRGFGWASRQFACLYPLWEHESGWNPSAENPGSGAYGIPQSLPGSQMASAGADWQTNPATQIRWGLTYIQGRYGSPCAAWAHEQSSNWY